MARYGDHVDFGFGWFCWFVDVFCDSWFTSFRWNSLLQNWRLCSPHLRGFSQRLSVGGWLQLLFKISPSHAVESNMQGFRRWSRTRNCVAIVTIVQLVLLYCFHVSQMKLMRFAARSHVAAPGQPGTLHPEKSEKSDTLRSQPEHRWWVGE